MSSIFVSYRRNDSPAHAGRIYDRLVDRFGEDRVFKDLDSLEPGADFVGVLESTIDRCDACIAVIGRAWLPPERNGRRWPQDPPDWVRFEIARALTRDIRVIPVLVQGASMPLEADLPEDLRALARRHAIELSETSWTLQLRDLIDSLARSLDRTARRAEPPPSPSAARRVPTSWASRELVRIGAHEAIVGPAFSPDGSRIAGAYGTVAIIWDSAGGRELVRFQHEAGRDEDITCVAFSDDGALLATACGTVVHVWDSSTAVEHSRFGVQALSPDDCVKDIAFSPGATRLAAASGVTGTVWDRQTRRPLAGVTHDAWIQTVEFSTSGERLVTASVDRTARIWDSDTGAELTRVVHNDMVSSAAFSPDGASIVTSSSDQTARVWDSETGRPRFRLVHDTLVSGAAFSPHGDQIATVSFTSVYLWDSESGSGTASLTHDSVVSGLAFCATDERVAVAGGGFSPGGGSQSGWRSRLLGKRFSSPGWLVIWFPTGTA